MENHTRLPIPADGQRWRDENGRSPAVPSQTSTRPGDGPGDDIDWGRWARVFWRHKWWILAAVLLGTTPSVFMARKQQTAYQATVELWINESQDQPWPIEVSTALTPTGLAEVISSGAVLEMVVRKLQLNVRSDPPGNRHLLAGLQIIDSTASGYYRVNAREDGTYKLLDQIGNELQRVERGEVIGEPFGFRWNPAEADLSVGKEISFQVMRPSFAADLMKHNLNVLQPGQDPRIISVSYDAADYGLAVDVIDALTVEFSRVASDLKRQEQATLVRTLKAEVGKAADSLRIAEANLQQFKVRTATRPDPVREPVIIPGAGSAGEARVRAGDPVFERYYALELERDSISQDREALAHVHRNVKATGTLDVVRLEAIPSVHTMSAMVAALEEQGRKEVELRTALQSYTAQHSSVRRLERDLTALRRGTIPELVVQLIERLDARLAELDRAIRAQVTELQQEPQRALEEARLQREVANAEEIFNSLQLSYKEAQVTEGATQANIEVLDRSVLSLTPVLYTPILVAFILSLSLGLGAVILYERFFERRIRYPDQVALDLGLHILGVVPNLRMLTTQSIGDRERSLDVWTAVESFRDLRTQLVQGLALQYPAIVAVTSPAPGDGKSLVAANLATSFAEPGRPTLIIDGDMRRGILHKTFKTHSSPGLSEYLRGEARLADIITMVEASPLSIIPRGLLARSAPELLDGDAFTELLTKLGEHFRVIIFDTPPLVGGVDGLLIGRHSSAVVAVLRAGQTTLDLARAKLEHYTRALKVPVVAVLNDVPTEGSYGYSGYVYSHYASTRD